MPESPSALSVLCRRRNNDFLPFFLVFHRWRLLPHRLLLLCVRLAQFFPVLSVLCRRSGNGCLRSFRILRRLELRLYRSLLYDMLPEALYGCSEFCGRCCSIPGHFPVPHRSLLWLLLLLLYEQDVEFPFVVPGLSGIQNSSFRLSIPWIHRLVRSLHRLLFCGRWPESFCDNLKLSRRCCNIQECFLPLRRSLLLL